MNTRIKNTFSRSELTKMKEQFINECAEQESRLQVAERIGEIRSFGDIKIMFESLIPELLGKPAGKRLINTYTKTLKENRSLKTLYGLHAGLGDNETADKRRVFMQEALSLCKDFDRTEYLEGMRKLSRLMSESMRELNPILVLEKTAVSDTDKYVNESVLYLASNKKSLKNLNDYTKHMDIVSENKNPTPASPFNVNEDLASIFETFKAKNGSKEETFTAFLETDNKEQAFQDMKAMCLEALNSQKQNTQDTATLQKLSEMESKLRAKSYCYESYTKDMIHMSDLQSILN